MIQKCTRRKSILQSRVCTFGFVFFTISLNSAYSVCLPDSVRDKQDAYQFVRAETQALVRAQSALERIPPEQSPPTTVEELIGQVTATLVGLKEAREEFACAAKIIAPFRLSNDGVIAKSSEAFRAVYSALANLEDQLIQNTQETLKGKSGLSDLGSTIQWRADMTVKFDNMWEALGNGTALSMNALVLPGQVGRLKITESQRKDLIREIDDGFGDAVKAGPQKDQSGPTLAAALIRAFLVNPDWKSKDGTE